MYIWTINFSKTSYLSTYYSQTPLPLILFILIDTVTVNNDLKIRPVSRITNNCKWVSLGSATHHTIHTYTRCQFQCAEASPLPCVAITCLHFLFGRYAVFKDFLKLLRGAYILMKYQETLLKFSESFARTYFRLFIMYDNHL